jgi:hypothetical protein
MGGTFSQQPYAMDVYLESLARAGPQSAASGVVDKFSPIAGSSVRVAKYFRRYGFVVSGTRAGRGVPVHASLSDRIEGSRIEGSR